VLKALLWDNDGVLVDTEPLFFQATQDSLAEVGSALTQEQFAELSLHRGESCFVLAEQQGHDREQVEEIRAWRNRRYVELLSAGVRVLDHIEKSLQSLHGRWPMAIVTSSNLDHFELIHSQTGLLRFFEFALTNAEYERHKPHPEPYLKAAERIGVDPSECLVIEDTERGLQAAAAAGMTCLVVPNGLSGSGNFAAAHAVLEHAGEIPRAIESLLSA
jgi:HAD superfamily hydrolase (TIGR01509 family)